MNLQCKISGVRKSNLQWSWHGWICPSQDIGIHRAARYSRRWNDGPGNTCLLCKMSRSWNTLWYVTLTLKKNKDNYSPLVNWIWWCFQLHRHAYWTFKKGERSQHSARSWYRCLHEGKIHLIQIKTLYLNWKQQRLLKVICASVKTGYLRGRSGERGHRLHPQGK